MFECVRWEEVEQQLDRVERNDWPAVVGVFLAFQNRLLDPRDTPGGRRKHVTIGSFCSHFKISRHLFVSWLELSTQETA